MTLVSETDYSKLVSGFTKLFSTIVHSTVWRTDMHVKVVWVTMLALANRNGKVLASVPGLADASRVSLEQCVDALAQLSAPDKWSRTKSNEGRRIEECDGGWLLLNYQKYRELRDEDERRIQTREAVRRFRNKKSDKITVSHGKPRKAQAEAEAEAEAEAKIKSKGETSDDFEKFWSAYPRKVGKKAAWTKWRLLNPDDGLVETILSAVAKQAESSQWHKDGGAFIPHPTTWLNQGRWEDEPLNVASTPAVDPVLAKRAADLKRIYG